jgi:hypothetical protein
VLNDTAGFYRFFDATAQAEFLYGCVKHTIRKTCRRRLIFSLAMINFVRKSKRLWICRTALAASRWKSWPPFPNQP